MPFTQGSAAHSDVEFRANTGQFKADMRVIRAEYEGTTGAMSTASLRATNAQEKLDRAIARHGPTSRQAREETVRYRAAMDQIARDSAPRMERAIDRDEKALGRFTRGALAGSGVLGRFRSAALFTASSLLGGYGLAYGIRTVIEEARNHQTVIAQTRRALEQQNISWRQNADEIEKVIQAQSKLTAFDDEELYASFTALFRRTGNVTDALKLNAIAADVARGRNIDLETAVRLVTRASIGQVGSLRRLGLDVQAVTTNSDKLRDSNVKATQAQKDAAKAADQRTTSERVLGVLIAKYGGSAAAFAKTDAGAQAEFTKALHDTEEAIGAGILPELTKLLRSGTEYLDQLNQSGQLQQTVERDARELGQAIRGIADALHEAHTLLRPVTVALGGNQQAAKDLAIIYLLLRTRAFGAALGLRSAGTAAATAGTESAVASGKIAGLGRGLRALPSRIGITIAVATIAYGPLKHLFEQGFGANFQGPSAGAGADPFQQRAQQQANKEARGLRKAGSSDAYIRRKLLSEGFSYDQTDIALNAGVKTGEDVRLRGVSNAPPTRRGGKGEGGPQTPGERYKVAAYHVAQAQASGDTQQLRKALLEEKRALQAELKATRDLEQRTQLLGQIGDVAGQIDQIDQAAEQKRKQREDARRRADEKRRREREAAARKRAAEQRKTRAAQVDLLTQAPLELRIAEQNALAHGASESRLLQIYRDELKAIEQQIPIIRKLGLGKEAIYKARQHEAAVKKKIDALTKKKTGTAADLFSEAAEEFRLYGSNVGRRGDPLSPQDARGALAADMLRELREINRHSKKTAHATGSISRRKPQAIDAARALARAGV